MVGLHHLRKALLHLLSVERLEQPHILALNRYVKVKADTSLISFDSPDGWIGRGRTIFQRLVVIFTLGGIVSIRVIRATLHELVGARCSHP